MTQSVREQLEPLYAELGRVLVGLDHLIERLLIGLLTDGHLLLEGVPGLAKTLAVRTLAKTLDLQFSRIQFTPDLLPADVVGTQIYNPRSGEFSIRPGPVFANVVLADEINRAPAKVQSALLEAMQERQVTLGETTLPLPRPFLVLATQNPIEQEGTYPLPEAQLDRFLLKVKLGYPSRQEELRILDRMGGVAPDVSVGTILSPEAILAMRQAVDRVYVAEALKGYIVDLVRATRQPGEFGLPLTGYISLGASPRGGLALVRAARAKALLAGREFVLPDDVKTLAPDVLRHRIAVSYEAEAEGLTSEAIIERILAGVPVP
jgi:MoxR-like ATPase